MWVIINLNPSTVLKTCLRHPSCDSAHRNKEGVFGRMRAALDKVIEIVTECRPNGETDSSSASLFTGIKELKVRVKSRFCSFSFFLWESFIMYRVHIWCDDSDGSPGVREMTPCLRVLAAFIEHQWGSQHPCWVARGCTWLAPGNPPWVPILMCVPPHTRAPST